MTIHVNTTDNYPRTFEKATGWHVDEIGYLHITKTGAGNIATFHPSMWASVERAPEAE